MKNDTKNISARGVFGKRPLSQLDAFPVLRVLAALLALVLISSVCLVSVTLASYPSDHTLTYKTNLLTWDGGTETRPDGSAVLTLFSDEYDNVSAFNGEKVFAPGTGGENHVILRNTVDREIKYTAVAYVIKDCDDLHLDAYASGGEAVVSEYQLPEGVSAENVINAVSGKVSSGGETPFVVGWEWAFEGENAVDTSLGNRAAEADYENATVGIYIVVEDEGGRVNPKTGDNSDIRTYVIIMLASMLVLTAIFIFSGKKSDKKSEKNGRAE